MFYTLCKNVTNLEQEKHNFRISQNDSSNTSRSFLQQWICVYVSSSNRFLQIFYTPTACIQTPANVTSLKRLVRLHEQHASPAPSSSHLLKQVTLILSYL
ncbi:hypothetical protein L3Y34_009914 [Caenorhabditis briggsae]|uniref:Uncharacterized protein n=1 Tax=Caenorhabditis briggsae TaxID=6238 RepID=A0AAE9A755_CAEBR|nr:hypothetical protein L3Y34_009914 [Caenorhabditis briggsae]